MSMDQQHIAAKKNILDLQHNKYVQYMTTTIVIAVTYVIGVVLALITKQVSMADGKQLTAVFVMSLTFFLVITAFMAGFAKRLNAITKQIEELYM